MRIAAAETQRPIPPQEEHFADISFLQTRVLPFEPPGHRHVGTDAVASRSSRSTRYTLNFEVSLDDSDFFQQTRTLGLLIDQFVQTVAIKTIDAASDCVDCFSISDAMPETSIQIDMQSVFAQLASYDQCFLVPHFALGPGHDLHPWLVDWWDCQSPVTHLWIYHDGARRDQGAGAAAAAFLFQPSKGWVFGGALSATFPLTLPPMGQSYVVDFSLYNSVLTCSRSLKHTNLNHLRSIYSMIIL